MSSLSRIRGRKLHPPGEGFGRFVRKISPHSALEHLIEWLIMIEMARHGTPVVPRKLSENESVS